MECEEDPFKHEELEAGKRADGRLASTVVETGIPLTNETAAITLECEMRPWEGPN